MKKFIMSAIIAAVFCSAPLAALAEDIDMGKITCQEFMDDEENMPMMIMWIDGYMSAASNNTILNDAWLERLGIHLGTFCGTTPSKTIMQAIEAMPAN